jgi:PKD repeat protein
MKKKFNALSLISILCLDAGTGTAQCHFIPSTSASVDTLSYTFTGGSFASYGCAPIDPTFWLSGSGVNALAAFVNPESYPSFRVWGMNDDDSAAVEVNGVAYPLDSLSASYGAKVVCGVSPGPDGIIFVNGKVAGANTNAQGNYSYQDVTINAVNVTTLKVSGVSGAGWGFAGITVDCAQAPAAAFTATPSSICPGTCISFTNLSLNALQCEWTFQGAVPASDTALNPSNICYPAPGSYDVTLIAANASGSDTLTLSSYITVYPSPPPQGIVQSGDTLTANPGAVTYQWYQDGLLIPGATNYFYLATDGGNYNVIATDSNGCEVEAVIFDVVAEMPGIDKSAFISVWPNPAQDFITVICAEEISAAIIYTATGMKNPVIRTVRPDKQDSSPGNSFRTLFSVDALVPGMYFLEAWSGVKCFRTKFIKQ